MFPDARKIAEQGDQSLGTVIAADIFETEDRVPGKQEVNLSAEAVSLGPRRCSSQGSGARADATAGWTENYKDNRSPD